MNKTLISLATCALALTACTSGDVLSEGPQSNTIKFKNVVNKASRSIDSESFSKFFVYGFYKKNNDLNTRFNIFTDTQVSKTSEGWASAINRYWVEDATYSFYAFSCENLDIAPKYGGPSVGQKDDIFRINYTCHTDDRGNSHDLVFASATGIKSKKENNEAVPLQFKHIMSKVSLQFVSDFPEGYRIDITNISISDFENMGTFVANTNGNSEGEWTGVKYDANNTNTFTLTAKNGVNTTGSDKDENGNNILPPVTTNECFMIPNTYDAIIGDNPVKIKFNLRLFNPTFPEEQQTIIANTLTGSWHPNWRQGTQYVYTVHLSGNEAGMDKIEFNVGVSDWNDPESDNTPENIHITLDYVLDADKKDEEA